MKAALAHVAVWTIRCAAIVVSVALVPLFFALAVIVARMEKTT